MNAYKQTSYNSAYVAVDIGEIQDDFNINFTLDGTKDSSKMIIKNFNGDIITPYTIIEHEPTNSWWIVKKDKVVRYQNEEGYFYEHTLSLLGATELLNARDLTDCGFNADRYTIEEFILRLFKLSSFEIGNVSVVTLGTNVDINQKVKFLKSFENYTLLSAVRELLEAYNCDFKISFTKSVAQLSGCVVNIYSRTGRTDTAAINGEQTFKDVRENKFQDSSSFGACVVSNANNVISSNNIVFPSVGVTKLVCDKYEVRLNANDMESDSKNLFIKLPSPAYKVNYIDFTVGKLNALFSLVLYVNGSMIGDGHGGPMLIHVQPRNREYTKKSILETCSPYISNPAMLEDLINQIDKVCDNVTNGLTWRLYDGVQYDPYQATDSSDNPITGYFDNYTKFSDDNGTFSLPENAPEDFKLVVAAGSDFKQYVVCLTDKNTKEHLKDERNAICWERGSDKIYGWERFAFYSGNIFDTKSMFIESSLLGERSDTPYLYKCKVYQYDSNNYLAFWDSTVEVGISDIRAVVNYIPMTDVKIKVDNTVDNHNVKMYNQNGKLSDGVGLSKLINSYSKEIATDNITKYMQYYQFSDIPKIGQVVLYGNDYYIINDVSMDITQNDSSDQSVIKYFYDCQFTLSKQIAVKSLMINPNTNIRDYQIPQNYNVTRKQLYRDYYEFSFTPTTNTYHYLKPNQLLLFEDLYQEYDNYINAIKISYVENDETKTWYYRLSTSRYNLEKMFMIVTTFNDNNIIGYDCQNRWSGFDIKHILTNNAIVTVPISYVDNKGEVESITMQYVTGTKALEYVNDLIEQHDQGDGSYEDYDLFDSLYTNVVFINEDIYNGFEEKADFEIEELHYDKDAIEVPFFEYVVQVDDSNEVYIGDKIMDQKPNCVYVYAYATAPAGTLTPNNADNLETDFLVVTPFDWATAEDGVIIDISEDNNSILFHFCDSSYVDLRTFKRGTPSGINTNKPVNCDIAIFRYSYNYLNGETTRELMLVLKNVTNDYYGYTTSSTLGSAASITSFNHIQEGDDDYIIATVSNIVSDEEFYTSLPSIVVSSVSYAGEDSNHVVIAGTTTDIISQNLSISNGRIVGSCQIKFKVEEPSLNYNTLQFSQVAGTLSIIDENRLKVYINHYELR